MQTGALAPVYPRAALSNKLAGAAGNTSRRERATTIIAGTPVLVVREAALAGRHVTGR